MRDRVVARLAEHEVDALAGDLLAHEAGLAALRHDPVLAVLVAVRARQVALARDVEHHRREREVLLGQDREHALLRARERADRPDLRELGDRAVDLLGAEAGGEERAKLRGRPGRLLERLQDRTARRVDPEDAGARHQVEEALARRLEGVELAEAEPGPARSRGPLGRRSRPGRAHPPLTRHGSHLR